MLLPYIQYKKNQSTGLRVLMYNLKDRTRRQTYWSTSPKEWGLGARGLSGKVLGSHSTWPKSVSWEPLIYSSWLDAYKPNSH